MTANYANGGSPHNHHQNEKNKSNNNPNNTNNSSTDPSKQALLALQCAYSAAKQFDAAFSGTSLRNPERERSIPLFHGDEILLQNQRQPLRCTGPYAEYSVRAIHLMIDGGRSFGQLPHIRRRRSNSRSRHKTTPEDDDDCEEEMDDDYIARRRVADRVNTAPEYYCLKYLQPGFLESTSSSSFAAKAPTAAADFVMETKILMNLQPHPNIVQVYGVNSDGIDSFLVNQPPTSFFLLTDRLDETLVERFSKWRVKKGYDYDATILDDDDENDAQPDNIHSNSNSSRSKNLKKEQSRLTQRLEVALDICSALVYLHDRQIVFNIRPDKVGFDARCKRIKLCHFGEARSETLTTTNHSLTILNSDNVRSVLAYTAPEILCKAPATLNSDVYAFSILLWELLTLQHPFMDIPDKAQHFSRVVLNHERPSLQSLEQKKQLYPKDIVKLLPQSWNPNYRCNMNTVQETLEAGLLFQEEELEQIVKASDSFRGCITRTASKATTLKDMQESIGKLDLEGNSNSNNNIKGSNRNHNNIRTNSNSSNNNNNNRFNQSCGELKTNSIQSNRNHNSCSDMTQNHDSFANMQYGTANDPVRSSSRQRPRRTNSNTGTPQPQSQRPSTAPSAEEPRTRRSQSSTAKRASSRGVSRSRSDANQPRTERSSKRTSGSAGAPADDQQPERRSRSKSRTRVLIRHSRSKSNCVVRDSNGTTSTTSTAGTSTTKNTSSHGSGNGGAYGDSNNSLHLSSLALNVSLSGSSHHADHTQQQQPPPQQPQPKCDGHLKRLQSKKTKQQQPKATSLRNKLNEFRNPAGNASCSSFMTPVETFDPFLPSTTTTPTGSRGRQLTSGHDSAGNLSGNAYQQQQQEQPHQRRSITHRKNSGSLVAATQADLPTPSTPQRSPSKVRCQRSTSNNVVSAIAAENDALNAEAGALPAMSSPLKKPTRQPSGVLRRPSDHHHHAGERTTRQRRTSGDGMDIDTSTAAAATAEKPILRRNTSGESSGTDTKTSTTGDHTTRQRRTSGDGISSGTERTTRQRRTSGDGAPDETKVKTKRRHKIDGDETGHSADEVSSPQRTTRDHRTASGDTEISAGEIGEHTTRQRRTSGVRIPESSEKTVRRSRSSDVEISENGEKTTRQRRTSGVVVPENEDKTTRHRGRSTDGATSENGEKTTRQRRTSGVNADGEKTIRLRRTTSEDGEIGEHTRRKSRTSGDEVAHVGEKTIRRRRTSDDGGEIGEGTTRERRTSGSSHDRSESASEQISKTSGDRSSKRPSRRSSREMIDGSATTNRQLHGGDVAANIQTHSPSNSVPRDANDTASRTLSSRRVNKDGDVVRVVRTRSASSRKLRGDSDAEGVTPTRSVSSRKVKGDSDAEGVTATRSISSRKLRGDGDPAGHHPSRASSSRKLNGVPGGLPPSRSTNVHGDAEGSSTRHVMSGVPSTPVSTSGVLRSCIRKSSSGTECATAAELESDTNRMKRSTRGGLEDALTNLNRREDHEDLPSNLKPTEVKATAISASGFRENSFETRNNEFEFDEPSCSFDNEYPSSPDSTFKSPVSRSGTVTTFATMDSDIRSQATPDSSISHRRQIHEGPLGIKSSLKSPKTPGGHLINSKPPMAPGGQSVTSASSVSSNDGKTSMTPSVRLARSNVSRTYSLQEGPLVAMVKGGKKASASPNKSVRRARSGDGLAELLNKSTDTFRAFDTSTFCSGLGANKSDHEEDKSEKEKLDQCQEEEDKEDSDSDDEEEASPKKTEDNAAGSFQVINQLRTPSTHQRIQMLKSKSMRAERTIPMGLVSKLKNGLEEGGSNHNKVIRVKITSKRSTPV